MRSGTWVDFWNHLGLAAYHFEDVGLEPNSTDLEIWQTCQSRQLIFITNNRNEDSDDSLEATIRRLNTADSLPVFTIGDLDRFRKSKEYAHNALETLYDYLLRIDEVRGTGRLFLP